MKLFKQLAKVPLELFHKLKGNQMEKYLFGKSLIMGK